MSLIVCHQYGDRLASSVAADLPAEVSFVPLGDSPDTAWRIPQNADVLLINQDSVAVGLNKAMPAPPGWPVNLRWVHLRSTGVDKYPEWLYDVPQITVTRGGYAIPIAEYVLAAMLTFAKAIPQIWVDDRSGWRHHKLDDLHGQTLGIIGFGEIGKEIARRALAFGMTVVGNRRSPAPPNLGGVELVAIADLLARSDHVVLCAPLTTETRGMLDARAFSILKPGAHLINVGRGALIVAEALRVALNGSLGGATLDVTDPEPLPDGHWLFNHPKVRISPHISGSSPQTRRRLTAFFINNLHRYLRGEELLGLIDKRLRY
jgi:phosphoglycerate dehydrogenase-like enzyme